MLCLPNQPGFCATASAASAGTSATNFDNSFSSYPPYNTHNNINPPTSSSNTPSGSLYSFPPPHHHMSTYDSFSTPAASTPCSAIPASRSWHQQPSSGNSTPTPLILDSLAASKVNMVENLVGTLSNLYHFMQMPSRIFLYVDRSRKKFVDTNVVLILCF